MGGIDKSWMLIRNHNSAEYRQGVKDFLDFAIGNVELDNSQIWCPCKVCNRVCLRNRLDCVADLIIHDIDQNYTHWYSHGEKLDSVRNLENEENDIEVDDMEGMIHDIQGQGGMDNFGEEEPNVEASKFYKLLKNAEQPLYPGFEKFSKLSFIVKLLHIKCLNGWSNRSFNMLLELLKEALPLGEMLPSSYYEAKKTMKDLGLSYEKIDSCINDCLLYRKQHEHATACHICGVFRYKHAEDDSNLTSREHIKIPAKVLFYFPIKDRLQRLYMSSKTASYMRWHSEGRPNASDGVMRHPTDFPAWKTFDVTPPSFAADPRNVRLGLAIDGSKNVKERVQDMVFRFGHGMFS